MKVGVVQMTSSDDLAANLAAARELVGDACTAGAEFVALPEMFAFLRKEGQPFPCAQAVDGEIVGLIRELAQAHGVWILGGTFPEVSHSDRVYNTSPLVSPAGEVVATYRKVHLFDVDLTHSGGAVFHESKTIAPGEDVVVAPTPFGGVGLSICYDVRFPELYRAMGPPPPRFLTCPAAFARETGKDHWEVLLRARAIENQAFVMAPAQVGQHGPDRSSYGRSMIIDPWGLVLARAADHPCAVVADCDLEAQERVRASVPALLHRRL